MLHLRLINIWAPVPRLYACQKIHDFTRSRWPETCFPEQRVQQQAGAYLNFIFNNQNTTNAENGVANWKTGNIFKKRGKWTNWLSQVTTEFFHH